VVVNKLTNVNKVGELTHPVVAALDHPLCCAKRVGGKRFLVIPLCGLSVDSPPSPLSTSYRGGVKTKRDFKPSLWLAGERVAERSKGWVSRRSAERLCQIKYILHIYSMPSITDLCRELRRKQTTAEEFLWQHLRNRNFIGKKFLRQHPICVESVFGRSLYYIPDFYCHEARLVIEADGPVHLFKKEYDKNRDEVLKGLGLTILRFTNDEILNDLDGVLDRVKEKIT